MFYTYLWLREDGTPYYVGKGKEKRAYREGCPFVTLYEGYWDEPDMSRIILQEHTNEAEAFEAEKFLIGYYGRVDQGTGCLRNLTDGGEGASGLIFSKTTLEKMRKAKTKDLSGQRFGRLTAVEFSHKGKSGLSFYKFRCDCGKEKVISGTDVAQGKTKSCGCMPVGGAAQPSVRKPFTKEARANISASLTGRKLSPEHIKHMVQGRWGKDERKEKNSSLGSKTRGHCGQ